MLKKANGILFLCTWVLMLLWNLLMVHPLSIPLIVCHGCILAAALLDDKNQRTPALICAVLPLAFKLMGCISNFSAYGALNVVLQLALPVVLLLFVLRNKEKRTTLWLLAPVCCFLLQLAMNFELLRYGNLPWAAWAKAAVEELMYGALFMNAAPTAEERAAKRKAYNGFYVRSVGVSLLLWFLTMSIYGLVWLWRLIKNTRLLCKESDRCVGEFLLVTLVPFYVIYWAYKRGRMLSYAARNEGYDVPNHSVLYLVMALLGLNIVTMCLMQDAFNTIAKGTCPRLMIAHPVAPATPVQDVPAE